MSAVLVKGIIISLSVVAAVGIALQSPEVREWMDEQRRKLAELLRTMSENLDPHTRSQAEAFAFEGRMPTPQSQTVAISTSREIQADTVRGRTQAQGTRSTIDAAERRRLGREYLARRNQELLDMRNKRNPDMAAVDTAHEQAPVANDAPPSSAQTVERAVAAGTFGHLISTDGTLKLEEPPHAPIPESFSSAPTHASTQQTAQAFQSGSFFGNPFGDEYALSGFETEGSQTPRPPVPPKISLEDRMPGSFPPDPPVSEIPTAHVSSVPDAFDEQLACALSLSLAESEAAARHTLRRRETEDEDFSRAVAASLSDAHSSDASMSGPLVDFSNDEPASRQVTTNPWRQPDTRPISDDELYYLTPTPTGRAVASPQTQDSSLAARLESVAERLHGTSTPSRSQTLSPAANLVSPSTLTLSPDMAAQDRLSTGFVSDSDTDEFASLAGSAHSMGSLVEVQVEDVDDDNMSDDDGVRTPGSWSEVSEVGSESLHSEGEDVVRV